MAARFSTVASRSRRLVSMLSLAGLALLLSSCMDQYNPRPYWEQFRKEREIGNRNLPKLTEKGELPPVEGEGPMGPDQAFAKYATLCASCHGEDGKAAIPAAAAMNPKPRNLTDAAWQASVTDDHLHKVIKEGGGAVGLSSSMPPWGAMLKDNEIDAIVAMIRTWSGK